MPQDHAKACELWHRAAKLGHAGAYLGIGNVYDIGQGVKVDKKKAKHYYELSAIGGDVYSRPRHNLGNDDLNAGNYDRALKHYMIAVRGGHTGSLKQIKHLYTNGHATKDDYWKHCNPIKHTWMRLKVIRGIKLLQRASIIVTISTSG